MSYIANSNILASDFVSLAGDKLPNVAFSSSAEAQGKIAALVGVGYGDRGYGQNPALSIPSAGQPILGSHWNQLRSALSFLAQHQGTSLPKLPPASRFDIGQAIYAETGTYDFSECASLVDANRFNTANGASMLLIANALILTKNTTWGGGNSSITATIQAAFSSENAARFFFNSGGEIRLVLSHPSNYIQQYANWSTLLSNIGTFALKARTSSKTGTLGSVVNKGFYDLTTTNTSLLTASGTSAYYANNVMISARVASVSGENGGNGTTIVFTIRLTDAHTGWSDIVYNGTKAVFSCIKATTPVTGIESPSFSVVTSW
jgi:hypothetical protein